MDGAAPDDEHRMSNETADETYDLAAAIVAAAVVSATCDIGSNPILMTQALLREITAMVSVLAGPGEGERWVSENAAYYMAERQAQARALEPVDVKSPLAMRSLRRMHRTMERLSDLAEHAEALAAIKIWPADELTPHWQRVLTRLQEGITPEGTHCLVVTCQSGADGKIDEATVRVTQPGELDDMGCLHMALCAVEGLNMRIADLALAVPGGEA